MSYSNNPYAPKARKLATNLVKTGLSNACVARMYGVHRSTIGKWMKKASTHSRERIWTQSSRPHHHPYALPQETIDAIIAFRKKTHRCAQVIHVELKRHHISVSLSSVKRIFTRYHLTRTGKKVAIHRYTKFQRPRSTHPGALVEVDTIHFVTNEYRRFYIYAVIDTYSRMGYAEYQPRISTGVTVGVIERALHHFTFPVEVIQTDNGHEFGDYLYDALQRMGIRLRHTRVRKPNDNAHVERFIRTIQEECFSRMLPNVKTVNKKLRIYIEYYNTERIHLGIECKTPIEMLPRS